MLIGLNGKARAGKDTACQFILDWAEENTLSARRDAFADRLKLSAARALGYTEEAAIAAMDVLKENGLIIINLDGYDDGEITGREYLQWYGTEAHREIFDEDFWVDAVLPKDNPNQLSLFAKTDEVFRGEIVVITDVRFPNEAGRIKSLGGEVWQIIRPGDAKEDGHASEQTLLPELIDHVIINDSTLDHLRDSVLSRVERLVYV